MELYINSILTNKVYPDMVYKVKDIGITVCFVDIEDTSKMYYFNNIGVIYEYYNVTHPISEILKKL